MLSNFIELLVLNFNKDAFTTYLSNLAASVPFYIYIILFSVFALGCAGLLILEGRKKGLNKVFKLILVEYVIFIVCSTIVFRQYSEVRPTEFRLLWSYERAFKGDAYLLYENIMNVMVFVPVGVLLGTIISTKKWWTILLMGVSLSICIELSQFVFQRGLCEMDDIIHNSVGCFIGLLIILLFKVICHYSTNCYRSLLEKKTH